MLEGRLLISVSGKELVLGVGDSLYFDSGLPHGMKALDGKPVRFLGVKKLPPAGDNNVGVWWRDFYPGRYLLPRKTT